MIDPLFGPQARGSAHSTSVIVAFDSGRGSKHVVSGLKKIDRNLMKKIKLTTLSKKQQQQKSQPEANLNSPFEIKANSKNSLSCQEKDHSGITGSPQLQFLALRAQRGQVKLRIT